MALERNAILDALTARLASVPGFKTVARVFRDLSPEEQPAMFVRLASQGADNSGPRTKWTLTVNAVVYVASDAQDGASVPLQDLIDGIEKALEPLPNESGRRHTTLGGLVTSCRIDGEFEIQEGELGTEAFAAIPIEIEVVA